MRRPEGLPKCEVPGCVRYAGKITGFCNRCWAEATEGERAGLLFARHAPLWPRYFRVDEEAGETVTGPDIEIRHGYAYCRGNHFGHVLAAMEASQAQASLADTIGQRRRERLYGA